MKLNSRGSSHASGLIGQGKITKGNSWSPPSASSEDAFIKAHGMSAYGSWFMGVDSAQPEDTKGHYGYPFSNDFSTVNLKGLIAIRQRAAQQGATDIFNAAGKLVDRIQGKSKTKGHTLIINL